jgi:transcriptional regulator with XRE-family HTH domain
MAISAIATFGYPFMDNFYMVEIKRNLAANLEFLMSQSQDAKTLMQLKEKSGVGYSTIRRMLSGEGNPTLDNLIAISKHFKVDIDRLLHSNLAISELSQNPLKNVEFLDEPEISAVQNLIDTLTRNRSGDTHSYKKALSTAEVIQRKRSQELLHLDQLNKVKSK